MREEAAKLSNAKRHSEGTFSNDYSKYLEDRKAQDFVRWLMNNKRSGWVSAAEYTSGRAFILQGTQFNNCKYLLNRYDRKG